MMRIAVRRVLPRRLPSPAMIVACLALTVALGGTSYAAIKLPAASVGYRSTSRKVPSQASRSRATRSPAPRSREAHALQGAFGAQRACSADISRVDYRQSTATAVPTSGHARRGPRTATREPSPSVVARSYPIPTSLSSSTRTRSARVPGRRRPGALSTGTDADGLRHLRGLRSYDAVTPKRARLAPGGSSLLGRDRAHVTPTRWCSGGFDEMSRATRLTAGISLMIRLEIVSSRS